MFTALRKTSLTDGFQDSLDLKSNLLSAVETTVDSSIYNINTTTGALDISDLEPSRLFISFDVDNSGPAKIQINGKAFTDLVSIDGAPLESHDIIPGLVYTVDYDGTKFLVNVESAETLSNVMRYHTVLPLPTGPNNKFTYEDFYNHYVPFGEATVLANIGMDFPKYKVYPYNGNDFVITYGLLKWEADYTKQTITLEIDFPEIEEKYMIVKYLVISKEVDDPTCRVAGSTEITSADWNRVRKEVVQSEFYEGHYLVTLQKPNSPDFFIEKTDGVEFAVGTSIHIIGQTFLNVSYPRDENNVSTLHTVLSVRAKNALYGRTYNRGMYTRVGKEGEPDKNQVINTYRYMSTSESGEEYGSFATLGVADHDTQFVDATLFMARPNLMTVNSTMYGTDVVYDTTSKQEKGVVLSSLSSAIRDASGKVTSIKFLSETISTSQDNADLVFHITIKSPRKSDLDNLKIRY